MQVSDTLEVVGNIISIETIMELYGKDIYHLVYCYVNDKAIAEDITQEVFYVTYLKLDTFREASSLKTWISRIAINKCKDYLRSSYFKRTFITNIISPFIKSKTTSPEDIVVQNEVNQSLTELVLNLPIKYKEVIILYYYQEFDVKEISKIIDKNEATIKSRLRRGRDQLKSMIEERMSNE